MVALTTHDTKRSEDVRARIGVLSQVPSLWAELVGKWALATPPPDAATGLFLLQNMFGSDRSTARSDKCAGRLHAYAEKAIREAASHTTWNDPNDEFEGAVHTWIDAVLDGTVGTEMTSLVARLDLHARSDALGQKLIALTTPGVPDIYQGTELWRTAWSILTTGGPSTTARTKALEALRHPKLRVVAAALRLRRDRPASFTDGGYTPLGADGPAGDHLVAFLRGDDVLTAVSRHTVLLSETGWGDTTVTLPDGQWTDRISGARFSGQAWPSSCSRNCRWRFWSAPMAKFAVWAPLPERVRVDVDGTQHEMTRADDGWWRAEVDAGTGARYGFVLDDDPTVLPDPRSPRQPDGVHARSAALAARCRRLDRRRLGGRLDRGRVIHELHVGTFTEGATFDSAIEKLDYLVNLGVDFVEVMPVNAFGGTHGWGYDGVLWYAGHEPTAGQMHWCGSSTRVTNAASVC